MSKNDPHILGKESIGKLLLQYSIPAIIGMTITSIYNIIDSIFIGHGVGGAMAIAGLAISFPLMNLVVAFCTLVSAGGSTLASIRLGQKDLKGATEILSHTLMLCITNSVFFGILSFIFLDDILLFFRCQSRHTSIRTQFHAGNLVGNSYYLYNDRIEQCDARYRVSEESNAYIDGDGSCQYHPRSYLYLPL